MGKNTKSAAQAAAEQAAPATTTRIDGGKLETPATKGLSQGEKVNYIAAIQTERAFMMQNVENPSQSMIDGFTLLAQATILDVAVGEIATGRSVVGNIITANENNYKALQAMALERGIKLPEYKALPAPTEEQLKIHGLLDIKPADAKVLNVEASNVSDRAIEQKKKEIAAVAKAVDNPAEIKTKEQLKASLTAMLVKPITDGIDRPDARVQRTIKFYRGYLTIQANAAEDKKTALEEMKAKTRQDMLNEIAEIVGPCPFSLNGTAYFLRKRAIETGSPISAFCLYRRSAVPEKDNAVDDSYVADITRILLLWSCNSRIAECNSILKEQKKHVENETGAAKAATEAAIRYNEAAIEEMKQVIEWVNNPTFDIVDSLVEDYNAEDQESEKCKLAHRIVSNIMSTYYPEIDIKKADKDSMLKNVQQRAGIIINMFRGPLAQSISYAEGNLTDIIVSEEENGGE